MHHAKENPMNNQDKALADALIREDFFNFLITFWPVVNPGKKFLEGWHHHTIIHALNKCVTSYEMSRLLINLPPQHGKSELVLVFWVAWKLGRDPSLKFICASFSDVLGARFGTMCLQIMQSAEYQRIFPGTKIIKATATEITTTKGGRRYATTVHGQVTGQPADIIIIDDPHKIHPNLSNEEIEKTNNWIDETLAPRLSKPEEGIIICIMQRVRSNDATAHLRSKEKQPWRQVKLPLIATEDTEIPIGPGETYLRKKGEMLHPAWRGKKWLAEVQENPRIFAAQYQQDPMPEGGVILMPGDLGQYSHVGSHHHYEHIIMAVDGASSLKEDASYSAAVIVGVRENRFYVFRAWRGHVELKFLKNAILQLTDEVAPSHIFIEDASMGTPLYQILRETFESGGLYYDPPRGSKEHRLNEVLHLFATGRILFPKSIDPSSHMAMLREELLTFPNGKSDDLVDALVHALQFVVKHRGYNRPGVNYPHYRNIRGQQIGKFWDEVVNESAPD